MVRDLSSVSHPEYVLLKRPNLQWSSGSEQYPQKLIPHDIDCMCSIVRHYLVVVVDIRLWTDLRSKVILKVNRSVESSFTATTFNVSLPFLSQVWLGH